MPQSNMKLRFPKNGTFPGSDEVPPYLFDKTVETVLRVAEINNRPVLISGPPGCGKTALAQAVAVYNDWNFLHHTFTSRSRLEELTGEVDQLKRLQDAQIATKDRPLMEEWAYLKPGIFWWAFDANSAYQRSGPLEDHEKYIENRRIKGLTHPGTNEAAAGTVLLLDEIDKAEPDLPNDLLEPFDTRQFDLPTGEPVRGVPSSPLLVLITTNRERDLPDAFVRRCVVLKLEPPKEKRLAEIARWHLEPHYKKLYKPNTVDKVAAECVQLQAEHRQQGRRPPGTSEFLDAVRACFDLKETVGSPLWPHVEACTLSKRQ